MKRIIIFSKKVAVFLLSVACTVFSAFAQDTVQKIPSYRIEFVRGDLAAKTHSVKEAASVGDCAFVLSAMDFALESHKTLGDDEELNILAGECVRVFSTGIGLSFDKEISLKLGDAFRTFSSAAIKTAVLETLPMFPSAANVSMVNAYVSQKMQDGSPSDAVLVKAVESLKILGNGNSFNILFIADILDVWPELKGTLSDSYGALAKDSEKEILNILSAVPVEKKLVVLDKMNTNPQISKKICGEVAENALSEAIYNVGEDSEISSEQIALQLLSLSTIAQTKWTRAAKLATDSFSAIRMEYEKNLVTAQEFAMAITNIAAVATSDTGQVLSSYLDFLNKSTEQNKAPVEAVVLSVINALGGLGDKSAFDYLLYVTYLDYPETVTTAAREALAKLKW